jgi:hypothetical protein
LDRLAQPLKEATSVNAAKIRMRDLVFMVLTLRTPG